MTPVDFTLGGYVKRLEVLFDMGYSMSGDFRELESTRTLYLRHDVDLSLEAAVEVAKVEAQLGVSSTYFVLLTSDFYNPLSPTSRKILEELLKLGHSLGLHFDSSVYRDKSPEALSESVLEEAQLLEGLTGSPTLFFSQHRPGTHGFFSNQNIEIHDVYSQIESPMISYFSDATGTFRFGDYQGQLEAGGSFQLLTHPIWWSATQSEHPRSTLEAFLGRLGAKQRNLLGGTVAKFDLPLGSGDGWPVVVERKKLGEHCDQ